MKQIGALTVVRGIAAWWVVLYHFRDSFPSWWPVLVTKVASQGFLAVDLFFILSGFVISYSYARLFETELVAISIRGFLLRRLARIYPLHLFMSLLYLANVVAITLFSHSHTLGDRYAPGYYVLSLVLLHNWGLTDTVAWNIPSWSISTEWLAYLCFPFITWIAIRTVKSLAGGGAAALFIASFLGFCFWASGAVSIGGFIPHLGALRCVCEFCMGICVFRAFGMTPSHRTQLMSACAAFAAIGLATCGACRLAPDYVTMPLAFAAFVYALSLETSACSRLFNALPLYSVGLVSYSTYMVHYFVKDWVKFVLVGKTQDELLPLVVYLATVAILSALLYRFIELPGRAGFNRLAVRWV